MTAQLFLRPPTHRHFINSVRTCELLLPVTLKTAVLYSCRQNMWNKPHHKFVVMIESNFMSPPSGSFLSWLLDRVLAFGFAYIMLRGARKISRHQEADQLAVDTGTQLVK